ncbi:uncharacterized protein LOC124775389 [Schistocerca piceifrons]|uniref:uncharacterized protein LOC124775389 n=1 Tax=Schistocerca piceifrons TaxID=274613 RepID=UPI001F5EC829|nr:uncharacterized protein LOC124775389 [Schistocerca piceifrons]
MDASGSTTSASAKWIDNPMIETALKKHRSCEAVTVQSISVELACKTGAGYGSQMYRVQVSFTLGESGDVEHQSLIVKADHDRGGIKELTEQLEAFDTESLILGEVMPTAHEALRGVEGASFRPLAATCLHHGATPRAFLVLDDLVAAGYRLADADRPLDYQHCEVVMRAYARLHAGTAHVLSKRPDHGVQLNMDMFAAETMEDLFRQMIRCTCSAIADFIKRVPGWEEYAPKYVDLANTIMPRVKDSLIRKMQDTKLKVLVHADCWKNNMMFKYSEEKVADVRFVDFQLTHASSPARDLVYFLFANTGVDVHERLPSLLETYHSQLQASLRALGMTAAADTYPLDELLRDIEDLQPFALFTSTLSGFVLSWERVGYKFSQALHDLNISPDLLYGVYDNEYSQPYMKYITRHFESKGLL